MYRNKCQSFRPERNYTRLCKSESLYNSCKDIYKDFSSTEEYLVVYLDEVIIYKVKSLDEATRYKSSTTYLSEYQALLKQIKVIEGMPHHNYVADNFNQIIVEEANEDDEDKKVILSTGKGVAFEVHFKALYYLVKRRWLKYYRVKDEKIFTISDKLTDEQFEKVCLILVHTINYFLLRKRKLPFKISLAVIIPFLVSFKDIHENKIKARLLKYFINYDHQHMFCKNDIKTLKEIIACDGKDPSETAKCFQDVGIETALPCAIDTNGNLNKAILEKMYKFGFQLRTNLDFFTYTRGTKKININNNVDNLVSVIYQFISPSAINRSLIWETFDTMIFLVNYMPTRIDELPSDASFIVTCFELLIKDFDGKIIDNFKHDPDEDLSKRYVTFIKKLFYYWTSSPIPSEECEISMNNNINSSIVAHTCSKILELPLEMVLDRFNTAKSVKMLYSYLNAVVKNVMLENMNII